MGSVGRKPRPVQLEAPCGKQGTGRVGGGRRQHIIKCRLVCLGRKQDSLGRETEGRNQGGPLKTSGEHWQGGARCRWAQAGLNGKAGSSAAQGCGAGKAAKWNKRAEQGGLAQQIILLWLSFVVGAVRLLLRLLQVAASSQPPGAPMRPHPLHQGLPPCPHPLAVWWLGRWGWRPHCCRRCCRPSLVRRQLARLQSCASWALWAGRAA